MYKNSSSFRNRIVKIIIIDSSLRAIIWPIINKKTVVVVSSSRRGKGGSASWR